MKEASCRLLDVFFQQLKREGRSTELLVEGTGYPLAHLRNKNERIEWEAFTRFMSNAGVIWTPAQLETIGMGLMESPYLRPFALMMKILFSAAEIYRWIFQGPMRSGNQVLTCIDSRFTEVEPTRLRITLEVQGDRAPCPEFFYVTKGSLSGVTRILALAAAEVSMQLSARGATYDVVVPLGGGLLTRIRRALLWPVTARAAAVELKDAHASLVARYSELEKATARIEDQQRALQLVHEISTVVQENLRLSEVAGAVASQVFERLRFDAVRLRIKTTRDGVTLEHLETRGDAGLPRERFHREQLVIGDEEIGELLVARSTASIEPDTLRLLDAIARPAELALSNALAYEVIATYRNELEAKVVARTAEVVEARDAIERSLESRNRFFANVNHEFRSPLTALLLSAERLEDLPALPASARSQLGSIQRNAERLHGLVDDLLMLSAGAEGLQGLKFTTVDVAQAVLAVVEAAQPLADAKGLKLSVHLEPDLKLEADRRQLDRALNNYVSNAIKYTDRGQIEVRAVSDGARVRFSVTDTGGGIPASYLPKVFERFVQVPLAVSRPGAGIGLALVKEIALQHQGEVAAESVVGQGSTFTLWLPLRADPSRKQEPVAQMRLPRPKPTASSELVVTAVAPGHGQEGRVLICEDNLELLENISHLVEGAGFQVDRVTNGEDALKVAKQTPPDLLLTDLNLGAGMDGIQLTRAFRELKEHRNAPVLLLTAAGLARDRLDAFDAGVVDYLSKPFHPQELIARLRAQLALRTVTLQLMSAERLAAQGAALAGVAHELRNPLNGLVNAVEPLRSSLPREALVAGTASAELLDVIEECGKRVAALSHELLFYTRTDAPISEVQSLNDLAARAVKLMGASLRQVTLSTGFRCERMIRASPTQLSQVIMNLLENAVDAAGPGGTVEIATRAEENCALLEVRDSGPGVPRHLRERIFEPFFTTKPPGKGTGLGLSISRDIVRRHGGNLIVGDGAERGCTMRMVLPALSGEAS